MSRDAYIDRVRRTIVEEVTELRWAGALSEGDIPRQAAQIVSELLGVSAAVLLPTASWARQLLSREYIVPPEPPPLDIPMTSQGARAMGVWEEPLDTIEAKPAAGT